MIQTQLETIISGSIEPEKIIKAVNTYFHGLPQLLIPTYAPKTHRLFPQITELKQLLENRIKQVAPTIIDIILEINLRNVEMQGKRYQELVEKDKQLWSIQNSKFNLVFGVLACVDKGVVSEGIIGVEGAMGRTLAGDIEIDYIPTKNIFAVKPSTIKKRMIHEGRLGDTHFVELLIEHTKCGRRGQMLANEGGDTQVPRLGYVIEHITALQTEFPDNTQNIDAKLASISKFWNSLKREGATVIEPDGGIYSGIITKIAQRQALKRLSSQGKLLTNPIELYDKNTGNLFAGLDKLDVLTDEFVLKNGGFTPQALDQLAKSGKIFSLQVFMNDIAHILAKHCPVSCGQRTYNQIQSDWLNVQADLVTVTQSLWSLHEDHGEPNPVKIMTQEYLEIILYYVNLPEDNEKSLRVKRRLLHHLFHTAAYAYTLDTFGRGNVPGEHIEDHLAVGDHEVGAKKHMALGQGDLDRPSANEIFTGYSVLLHSKPGKAGSPIVVMIKMDTERTGGATMTDEETAVALQDYREALKLWPYYLVGDMIPVIVVRGKKEGGISRLGLSAVMASGDIVDLLEMRESPLPEFIPANNSRSEIVFVPAWEILRTGIKAQNDLKNFRKMMTEVADLYSNSSVQESFKKSLD